MPGVLGELVMMPLDPGSRYGLEYFGRPEFLAERWHHEPGEGVMISQRTQGGKTRFAWQLMEATPHDPRRPPVALVMKPKDPTPAAMTRRYGWKEIATWPPPPRMPWQSHPPGYTLWPRHTLSRDPASISASNANLKRQFSACLMDTYRHGERIVFCDEVLGLVAELDLLELVLALSNRGAGMGADLWFASQKVTGTSSQQMPSALPSNPVHKFFGQENVEANRKAVAKVSGVNSGLVLSEMEKLQTYPIQTPTKIAHVSDLLYHNANGPDAGYLCIVGVQ